MEKLRTILRSRSPIAVAAVLSVLLLVVVAGAQVAGTMREAEVPLAEAILPPVQTTENDADWRQEMMLLGIDVSSPEFETVVEEDSDYIAMIGPHVMAQILGQYVGLQENSTFNPLTIEEATFNIAANLRTSVAYKTYTVADIPTDDDTSHARMLVYRSDLRDAFAPLLLNTRAEFEIFGQYIETSDPARLDELRAAAVNYRDAIALTAAVIVPKDAVNYHRSILNAMEEFAAVLNELASYADDPFASIALLRSYNTAEEKMYTSFDRLASYYGQKQP